MSEPRTPDPQLSMAFECYRAGQELMAGLRKLEQVDYRSSSTVAMDVIAELMQAFGHYPTVIADVINGCAIWEEHCHSEPGLFEAMLRESERQYQRHRRGLIIEPPPDHRI